MPTFEDPKQDAVEASEALRGLAHATRAFTDPADTYPVIGDLLSGIRSLRQVFEQLSAAHVAHRARAYDDAGSQATGVAEALAAAEELRKVVGMLDAAEVQVDAASQHSGRIAWHPAEVSVPRSGRWISVVFLDGEEADRILDLIHASGTDATIEHLAGYDHGEDTVRDALANGYVYDFPPRGALDRVATHDVYTMTYNPFLGHVSLLREYDAIPDPALLDVATSASRTATPAARGASRGDGTDWFAAAPRAAATGRGLSL